MIRTDQATLAGIAGPLVLEDVLYQAGKSGRIAPLQVVRADRVLGADHVRSAAVHAERAFAEGRNHASDLAVEFTRYLAGERQIRKAIDKVGVRNGDSGVVVALGEKRDDAVAHFIHALGLKVDDSLIEASDEKALAFGITALEAKSTSAPLADLVLERVAAVDLMRK